MIRILKYEDAGGLITRKAHRLDEAEQIVAPILKDVRDRGDAAQRIYAALAVPFVGLG